MLHLLSHQVTQTMLRQEVQIIDLIVIGDWNVSAARHQLHHLQEQVSGKCQDNMEARRAAYGV